MPKINQLILKTPKITYAKETAEESYAIDCSAGCNPYGFSPAVREALSRIAENDGTFYDYPHGNFLKKAITAFWQPYVQLNTNNITLLNGSIEGIYLINQLFMGSGNVPGVLGIAPQFSDYVLHARLFGYNYTSVPLNKEHSYEFDTQSLISQITPSLSLIYLDTPNNPTGQIISLNVIKQILDEARKNDICVIIDEAYGDYFDLELSAITLLNDYDNLIVLRTFSKGMGLAGLHAGYMLASEYLTSNFDKLTNPYVVCEPARLLAVAALTDFEFVKTCSDAFAKSKAKIRNSLPQYLKMAHTFDPCPIFMLTHTDESVDLCGEFAKLGVKVYSGADFETLGSNSVRVRIPRENQVEALIGVIGKIK